MNNRLANSSTDQIYAAVQELRELGQEATRHTIAQLTGLKMTVVDDRLRTCSKSPEQKAQECQVDELQAGVEQPLAVLPQPPVLLQPGKAALDDPALGHHLERMQFTALGDLYRDVSAQNVLDALGKRSAHIAAVTQQGLHPAQSRFAALQCLQGTFAVRYLGRGHRNSVR